MSCLLSKNMPYAPRSPGMKLTRDMKLVTGLIDSRAPPESGTRKEHKCSQNPGTAVEVEEHYNSLLGKPAETVPESRRRAKPLSALCHPAIESKLYISVSGGV